MQVQIKSPKAIDKVAVCGMTNEACLLKALQRRYGVASSDKAQATEAVSIKVRDARIVAMMREEKRVAKLSYRAIAEEAINNMGD